MKFLQQLLLEFNDELLCPRCGEELETNRDFDEGVCELCRNDHPTDRNWKDRYGMHDDPEEECEYMEVFVDPSTNKILSEAAVRQFKLKNKKIKRMYRCTSGPKKGRPVSDPKQCMQRKDPAKVRQGKKNMRRGKAVRKRKAKITRRTTQSRIARTLNKSLKGNQNRQKKLSTVLKPSSTKLTRVDNVSSSTLKTKGLEKPKKPKKTKK